MNFFLLVSPAQIILILFSVGLIFGIPLWFIIPNRNFKNIDANDIQDTIRALKNRERISFKYKTMKIALKRENEKLLIEPYLEKINEILVRITVFIITAFLSIIFLTFIASILDVLNIGDRELSGGYSRIMSWTALLENSMDAYFYIYFIVFYFLSKTFRKFLMIKFFKFKYKKHWEDLYRSLKDYKFLDFSNKNLD